LNGIARRYAQEGFVANPLLTEKFVAKAMTKPKK